MLRPLCLFVALFSLLVLAHPAPCQSTDFVAALSGDKYPLTLKLKDLDSSWRGVKLGNSGDAGDQLQVYAAMITGSTQSLYYTKGETVILAGELYLVAYHHQISIDYAALLRGGATAPVLPKPTPDTTLSLSLLNVRLIGSLTDIQPFSLDDALNPAAASEPDPNQASISNLKQIGLALVQYVQDYDEQLPPMKTVAEADEAIYPYLKDRKLLEHPKTHELYQTNTSLSHRSLASFNDPSTMVTYYEASPADDGLRAVLFLDGHVKRVPDTEWQRLRVASHVPNPQPASPVPKSGGE